MSSLAPESILHPAPAAACWRVRAFGSAPADLEIDFTAGNRAATATALLAACLFDPAGQTFAIDELWDWSLNRRLQGLLAVRLAGGDDAAQLQTACGSCREAMEFALDLHGFAAPPAPPRFTWRTAGADANNVELELRLPSGRDLERWTLAGNCDADAIAAELLTAVAGQPPPPRFRLPQEWLAGFGDAFEAQDPLTALELQARCPACAHDNRIDFDLEEFLLRGFAAMQRRLLDDICRLALAFHWREAEILALPMWRRAHYLQQLDGGSR